MNSTTSAENTARVIAALGRRWLVVVIVAVLGAAAAFAISSQATPIYQSSSSLYFALRTGTSGSDINQGSTYTQNQMLSFAQLAGSSLVLEKVIDDLELEASEMQLRRMLTITIPQNTVVLDVGVGSSDKLLAAQIANSVAESLIAVVSEISPADTEGAPTVIVKIIEPAIPAVFQSSPDKKKDTVLGGILGALLAALGVTGVTLLDNRVRSESAVANVTERPFLGAISSLPRSADSRPIMIRSPNGAEAEQYRKVRSSLRFASASHAITSLAVTSSIPGEGKSTIATNLALAIAETGAHVLLIDADLRRPRVAEYLQVENAVGLTSVLVDGVHLADAVHSLGTSRLDVLAAGEIPPNPAELLASVRMQELLTAASQYYDFIVIDTAPILSVADAAVLAQRVDSTLMVVDAKSVTRKQLAQSLDTLESAGTHIAGIVLNRGRTSKYVDPYFYGTAKHDPKKNVFHRKLPVKKVNSSAID